MQADSSAGRESAFGRRATLAICALVMVAALLVPVTVSAESAPLPTYEGLLTFKAIEGPADPEEYSWELPPDPERFLKQIDDQHIQVYYGEEHPAFGIHALEAHDAEGATVPTTLSHKKNNIVTLIVHHRAGNPAAAGAPFRYPVSAGKGWEGGFVTTIVPGPPPELPAPVAADNPVVPPAQTCVVPGLLRRSLKVDRRRLKRAGCRLGTVKGERSKQARVVAQDPQPGTALPAGSEVSVKLGG